MSTYLLAWVGISGIAFLGFWIVCCMAGLPDTPLDSRNDHSRNSKSDRLRTTERDGFIHRDAGK